ncbi:MAG: YbaB/EbfC family nucleoid-associated protein [Bacilli bacterium]|nr:YbaB/EbfC family nucleoid-associated protein [Bacilli bacterium]
MDMKKLMMQAQKMQAQMKKKQDELDQTLFETEAGGGAIKVQMYGNYTVEKIEIDKDAIDPEDKEMLEEMITIAINSSIETIRKEQDEIAQSMQAGFPGM